LAHTGAEQWDANAEADAFWAILTDPARTSGRWTERDFFETGEVEWRSVRKLLLDLGALPRFAGTYLDFGCGVGRITRQLAAEFSDGVGVDVSERMVAIARGFNPRIRFEVNPGPGLPTVATGSVEFVYSHLVLQHMAPQDQEVVIREFLRILAPGGIAAFQVATERDDPRPAWRRIVSAAIRPIRRVKAAKPRPSEGGVEMSMNPLPDRAVRALVQAGGGHLIAAPYTNSTDAGHNGALLFSDRAAAIRHVRTDPGASRLLSRFYVVRARTNRTTSSTSP
jgi:SAM-dependent methyltransferase